MTYALWQRQGHWFECPVEQNRNDKRTKLKKKEIKKLLLLRSLILFRVFRAKNFY